VNDLRESLKQEFKDPDIRYAYAESSLNTRIASQIKVLREQRGETQDKIAERCGTKQAGFSRFEDANHSVWKTDTLWKIARALDVRLHISFETFGSLIEDKERFSREYLERPGFEDDPAFKEPAQEPAAATTTPQLAFVPYDLRTRTLAMAMAEDVCALWPGYVESGNVALGTCAENFPNGMTLWGMAGVTHQNVPGLIMAPSQMGQLAAEHQISPIKGRINNIEGAKQRFTSTDILSKTFTASQKVAVDDYYFARRA
jgi:transcriptional regulator with XRE-family HTH domain